MTIPQLAIVGRPNVGKSSLFNWLAGRRIAIVDPTPGVTRDRLAAPLQIGDRYAEIIDTGGMGNIDCDNLTDHVEQQINLAIDQAQVILFVVDARAGLMPLDHEVAKRLRPVTKPILLVVNKCDHANLVDHATEFHQLGPWHVVPVSAQQNRGRDELFKEIKKLLPPDNLGPPPAEKDEPMKLAIVGRRNTGKSTFINCLAQAERTIVSEVAGTTRDSIDVCFERDGKSVIAIDTAGVRRKASIRTDIEFYSSARAERSIRRADVVLLFHDAEKNVSMVDKQLAGYVVENYKPAIFVVNKWDLLAPMPTGEFADYLHQVFPSLDFVPVAFITAKNGRNVHPVLNLARNLFKQASARVTTGDLNRVLHKALTVQPPPNRQNRNPKIYYATQVAILPPTLVLMTNGAHLFDITYQRYLLKMFRDHLPFKDVPIKMYLRSRKRTDREEPEDDDTVVAVPRKRPKPPEKKKPAKARKKSELWQDV